MDCELEICHNIKREVFYDINSDRLSNIIAQFSLLGYELVDLIKTSNVGEQNRYTVILEKNV